MSRRVKEVSWIWITPSLVAIGVVTSHYADTAGHWTAAVRPLIAAVLLANALQGACLLVTRDRAKTALFAVLGVLFMSGQVAAALISIGFAIGAAYLSVRRAGYAAASPAVALIVAGSVFLTGVIQLTTSGAVSLRDLVPNDHGPIVSRSPSLPDVYVLLLDGYARADTLESTFHHDNRPFLAALERRGFDVYDTSTTEYDLTSRTILNVLSGTSADLSGEDGVPVMRDHLRDREVRRRLAEAPGLTDLHRAGYETVVVLSPVAHVAERGWDITIDTGQVTDLEVSLLRNSPAAALLASWVIEQLRGRLQDSIAAMVERSTSERQQAVLVHLMAPHPPFMYSSDGSPMPPPECWPADCHLYATTPRSLGITHVEFTARYTGQIAYLNALLIPALDTVISNNTDAVIVVMSDHGSRYSTEDEAERHRNLLAVRSPSHPSLLMDEPTPDRLLQRILDALLEGLRDP